MRFFVPILVCLTMLLATTAPRAQENPAEKKPAEKKPAEKKPAEKKAANSAGSPAEEFAALHGQWKKLLTDLRALKEKAKTVEGDKLKPLQEQWNALVGQGDKLLDQMRTSGVAAYKAAPNADRRVTRFLVKLLKDDVTSDKYDAAFALGKTLIDNQCEQREIHEQTGVAAFAINNFDAAEVYLGEAKALNQLDPKNGELLDHIADYKAFWKKEQELRAKEKQANDLPRVKLTTEKGVIVIELFENEAPETVGNFVSLVKNKFYDGIGFHRVLPGFMAQGGCPLGDGRGGPGYKIYCEWENENARMHFRGTLSMAHSGKDTGGSQFFLTFRPTPHLNKKHTAFGRVIEGLDVLAKIQRRDPNGFDPPEPDKIIKAEVVRTREHAYAPNKVQ